jgi:hypothetical protein
VKQIILLSIAITGLGLLGVVYAAPPASVNHTDVAVMTPDAPDASSTPARLARVEKGCRCCWKTHRGVTRCKWMKPWRCRLRGGRCAEQSIPKAR